MAEYQQRSEMADCLPSISRLVRPVTATTQDRINRSDEHTFSINLNMAHGRLRGLLLAAIAVLFVIQGIGGSLVAPAPLTYAHATGAADQ